MSMDVTTDSKSVIKSQYLAALEMLREIIRGLRQAVVGANRRRIGT